VELFYLQHETPNDQRKAASQPAHRAQIGGLRFYELDQGRQVVLITVARFALRSGRIGFFGTGPARKATIQNAMIDIYAHPQSAAPGFFAPCSQITK